MKMEQKKIKNESLHIFAGKRPTWRKWRRFLLVNPGGGKNVEKLNLIPHVRESGCPTLRP